MQNEFLTLLTDGKIFVAAVIQPREMAESRVRAYDGRAGFKAVSIPLATVLSSQKLFDALQGALKFLADLNGSPWISGADAGSFDMRQRAKVQQAKAYVAISEATEGGVAELPRQSSTDRPRSVTAPAEVPHFLVCAYRPANENYPVLAVMLRNNACLPCARRGYPEYKLIRDAAGGDHNIVWLYGQQPQPLD